MKTIFYKFLLITGFAIISIHSYSQPVIADHRAVDRYSAIPDEYITEVKKMLLNIAGQSHARGYRYGLELLAAQDAKYAVSIDLDDAPELPSISYLRVSGAIVDPTNNWDIYVGEEDAWTTPWAVNNFINTVAYMDNANNPRSAIGFGWCQDMFMPDLAGTVDPVYGCRWGGRSNYYNGSGETISFAGEPGWMQWGLDNEDSISLGGSRVTMDMYLRAIETVNASSSKTTVFFTTGPVDYETASFPDGIEDIYSLNVKHNYIRDYVKNSSNGYLFDYADIMCWSEAGEERTEIWNGHIYQNMQLDYEGDYEGGTQYGSHISEAACLRLGKAMWWMLAHMAGWKDETITAINDVDLKETNDKNYIVFPNPAKERITISSELINPVDVRLINNSGKVILNEYLHQLPGELDLENLNLPETVYFLKIDNGENTSVVKILIL